MVPSFIHSPRARRRAATVTAALATAAALAGAAQLFPDGRALGAETERGRPAAAQPLAPASAEPKPVPLARADRQAIDRALDRFVPAAVRRAAPAAAYDLVTPALRAGTTRADWATGTIPVQPFPARGARFRHWTLSFSYRNHVGLELLLRPAAQAKTGPIAFAVDFRRVRGRWLVDSFIPAAVYSASGAPPRISAVPDFGPTAGAVSPGAARLDPVWFLLPASLLVLSLLVLIAYAATTWLRDRRALRGAPRTLPPLPAPARSRIAVARSGRDR